MKVDIEIPFHGGQLRQIAERFGVSPEGLLDFSANINPEGPPESVVQALQAALRDPGVLTQYPDLEEKQLRLSIAAYTGVAPETIVVANGFVPLLDAVLRSLPIRRCLLPVPAFGEYRKALERARVAVTPFVLDEDKDFRYPLQSLLEELNSSEYDSILLANPQNPSGVLCDRAELITFVQEASTRNIFVLLDEAFIDYAPMHSLISECDRFKNLVVFRSVTKFHGIPGLRVAYAVTNGSDAHTVQQSLPPWSITTMAAMGVCAALRDAPYAQRALLLNEARKGQLISEMTAQELYVYPAAANFVLIRFLSVAEASRCWERLIVDHGIVLRCCSNFEGISHQHLRCAIRGEVENARLLLALGQVQKTERAPTNGNAVSWRC